MTIHPIEIQSYEILAKKLDLSALPPLSRAVASRVAHATADLDLTKSLVLDEQSLEKGVEALRGGAPVLADVRMLKAGITHLEAQCFLDKVDAFAKPTRSAAAMRIGCEKYSNGAIVVVGCAPSALVELIEMYRESAVSPALVIGLPVGFVGASESKELLRASDLAAISNVGERGGSAAAAAVVNALYRVATGSPNG